MTFDQFEDFKVTTQEIKLSGYPTQLLDDSEEKAIKQEIEETLIPKMDALHQALFAEEKNGVLLALQAMDAAGKDEIIEHIFSALLPQGLKVTSFSKPSEEEQSHDYLWRMSEGLPKRGQIAILNRSYYEDIISPIVHESLEDSKLPEHMKDKEEAFAQRSEQIKNFERYLAENGFPTIKFFFNLSKETQAKRLIERIEDPKKNHEFSESDIEDRDKWDLFQDTFEKMINATASLEAPWYILPADNPWLSRKIATQAIIQVLEGIDPQYPTFSEEEKEKYNAYAKQLKNGER